MSSTDKLVIPAYKQSSEREFNEWFRNLRTAAKQHKYLLDIIEVGTIRPGAEREAEAEARLQAIGSALLMKVGMLHVKSAQRSLSAHGVVSIMNRSDAEALN